MHAHRCQLSRIIWTVPDLSLCHGVPGKCTIALWFVPGSLQASEVVGLWVFTYSCATTLTIYMPQVKG